MPYLSLNRGINEKEINVFDFPIKMNCSDFFGMTQQTSVESMFTIHCTFRRSLTAIQQFSDEKISNLKHIQSKQKSILAAHTFLVNFTDPW